MTERANESDNGIGRARPRRSELAGVGGRDRDKREGEDRREVQEQPTEHHRVNVASS